MSDVKLTREHRLAAALLGDCLPLSAAFSDWVESGQPSPGFALNYATMIAAAKAIAKAEHNLRAAVIADLRGLVERASPAWLDGPDLVSADSIELLIETLEAQQS